MKVVENIHVEQGAQQGHLQQASITYRNVSVINLVDFHKHVSVVIVTRLEDASNNSGTVLDRCCLSISVRGTSTILTSSLTWPFVSFRYCSDSLFNEDPLLLLPIDFMA